MILRGGSEELGLVAAVVVAMVTSSAAQTPGCTTVLITLAPCLGFIQGNSTVPPLPCCAQLANIVQSQPQCLCQVLNGNGLPGIPINRTQALALPAACLVQTPPVSQCNAIAGPAASPTEAPSPSPTGTPPVSPGPVAGGSKASGGGSKSAGSSNGNMTLSFIVSVICVVASYAFTAGGSF